MPLPEKKEQPTSFLDEKSAESPTKEIASEEETNDVLARIEEKYEQEEAQEIALIQEKYGK